MTSNFNLCQERKRTNEQSICSWKTETNVIEEYFFLIANIYANKQMKKRHFHIVDNVSLKYLYFIWFGRKTVHSFVASVCHSFLFSIHSRAAPHLLRLAIVQKFSRSILAFKMTTKWNRCKHKIEEKQNIVEHFQCAVWVIFKVQTRLLWRIERRWLWQIYTHTSVTAIAYVFFKMIVIKQRHEGEKRVVKFTTKAIASSRRKKTTKKLFEVIHGSHNRFTRSWYRFHSIQYTSISNTFREHFRFLVLSIHFYVLTEWNRVQQRCSLSFDFIEFFLLHDRKLSARMLYNDFCSSDYKYLFDLRFYMFWFCLRHSENIFHWFQNKFNWNRKRSVLKTMQLLWKIKAIFIRFSDLSFHWGKISLCERSKFILVNEKLFAVAFVFSKSFSFIFRYRAKLILQTAWNLWTRAMTDRCRFRQYSMQK